MSPRITDAKRYDSEFLDKRIKLLQCQRERMVREWKTHGYSQRKLAAMFNVSRRLVTFVLDPHKKDKDLQRRAERGGSKHYYDKKAHALYTRKKRERKYKILGPGTEGYQGPNPNKSNNRKYD